MTTWTKGSKHSASWGKSSKNTSTWAKVTKSMGLNSFLLLENGGYILQEDGISKLILEQSNPSSIAWAKLAKS